MYRICPDGGLDNKVIVWVFAWHRALMTQQVLPLY